MSNALETALNAFRAESVFVDTIYNPTGEPLQMLSPRLSLQLLSFKFHG
jgi:hypothetical protein